MVTTIQISGELKNALQKRKLFSEETYEDVIWDLVEDTMELTEETKREIAQAREDYKKGRVFTLEQVKRELRK